MKIICISDTHGLHHNINVPDGDMLIHAGDLTVRGTLEQINDSFAWLGNLPHKYKIVVAGNHDFGLEQKIPGIIIPKGLVYLENNLVELGGLKIWGSPISTPFYDWAFMWDITRRRELYESIPLDTDIVINHGPPFGVFDWTSRSTHAGCEALRERLNIVKPKLCVFGHIHEDYGICEINGTTYINAAILDKKYQIAHLPVIVEI